MRKSAFGRRNAILGRGVSTAGLALIAIVAVALIVRLVFPGAISMVVAPFSYISRSALSGVAGVGASVTGPASLRASLDESEAYAKTLEEQNRALASRLSDLEALLGTRSEVPQGVLAGVIARPPESLYDTLIIDQGADVGVAVGSRVEGPGGVPLGTVAAVTPSSARVLLYSAPGVVTEGWAGETRTPLTITGAGSGAFEATAPREALIVVGDLITIPGPGALPLGTVSRVESDPSSTSATIFILPLANLFTLTWVSVLAPFETP